MEIKNILFIQAISQSRYGEEDSQSLGLAYIASFLRKYISKKYNMKIVSVDEDSLDIKDFKPDIVLMTTVTQNYENAKKIAKKIKEKSNIPIIIGGHHISALPHTISDNMDIAVIGEGEETAKDLILTIEKYGLNPEELKKVDGIAFKIDGEIHKTSPRKKISNLDEIPFPARDLLDIPQRKTVMMMTSRGCPFKCPYCSSSHFWKTVSFFSADYVMREIKLIIEKYDPEIISFYDDLFTMNLPRLQKIIEEIEKEGYNKKISFSILARTSNFNDNICQLLKRINVKTVLFGFESACDKTLKYLKQGTTKVSDHENAMSLCKKYGFGVCGTFIIGSPDETEEDIKETYDFIKKHDFTQGSTFVLAPYPGTSLWDYAKQKGLVDEFMDFDKLNVDFDKNYEQTIIVADKVNKENLYKWFIKFKKLWESKYVSQRSLANIINQLGLKGMIEFAIKDPKKTVRAAFSFLGQKLKISNKK